MRELKKHQGQTFRRFEDEEGTIYCECRKCKEVLPETKNFFYKQKTAKSGLRSICKKCCDEYQMERYYNEEGFKEVMNENSKKWSKENPEKVRAAARIYYRKVLERDPEGRRAYVREAARKFKEKQKAGIYKITCKANGKIYIGETKNFKTRWTSHKSALKVRKKTNSSLQADWDKYGKDLFSFEVIEELEKDKVILYEREGYWIDRYQKEGKELYNVERLEE